MTAIVIVAIVALTFAGIILAQGPARTRVYVEKRGKIGGGVGDRWDRSKRGW